MNESRTGILTPHVIGDLVSLVNDGRPREAEYKVRALLQAFPNVGMLWKILGVALLRQGGDALQALLRTAELMPEDAEAHDNLGAALTERGQLAEALASWRRALAIQPRHFDALIGAADALRALGRPQESVAFYQRALEVDPRSLEAHNNLGNAYLELRRLDAAAGCYRRALVMQPDDAVLLCNLGNALRQLGSLEEALTHGLRAIELEPRSSVAHNNLGLILAAQGSREAAVASYRQALLLNPADVEALSNLGHVLRDLGQRREAAALYGKALDLNPSRAESHCNLGNALFDLMRMDAAVECYRHALELAPDHAAAHLSLSVALRFQRRADEAEASCQAALAIEPRHAEALSFLGELAADRGRFAEAQALFRRALDVDPGCVFAYCGIAMHSKMAPTDVAWLGGAEALLDKPLPLRSEISLRYALGKYHDDVGRYDLAFEQYRQANELSKRQEASYDRAKFRERVERVMARCDATFIRQAARYASASELPVFIVGMPRSGTSLAEQILASHPAVVGAGELRFWDAAFEKFDAAGRDPYIDGADFAEGLRATAREYLARLPAAGAALRVVDKMPANFLYMGFIHAVFPNARIIHMQRHPIDTCLSIYFQNFAGMGPYANDLQNLAHHHGEYQRVTAHWRALLPAAALLEIPYEALVADQETWTRRMVEFVGLPWDPQCLDFHQTERVVITASRWQVRQKISTTSAGRWKNYAQFLGPLMSLEYQ